VIRDLGTPAELREAFERGLADYYVVGLYVRHAPGVVVPDHLRTPEWLAGEAVIRLDYGLDMPIPIDDLSVTCEGVSATLSFDRSPHHTHVPWEAVVAVWGEGPRPKKRPALGLVP
jgi:hypothetical protein